MYPKSQVTNDIEAFGAIKMHLLTQKKRSSIGGTCLYRQFDESLTDDESSNSDLKYDFEGPACAIGCLIGDDAYDVDLEERQGDDWAIIEALSKTHPSWKITDESKLMIRNMQFIHDKFLPEYWPEVFSLYGYGDLTSIELRLVLNPLMDIVNKGFEASKK